MTTPNNAAALDFTPCPCGAPDELGILIHRCPAPHQLRGDLYVAICSQCGRAAPFVSLNMVGHGTTSEAIKAWNATLTQPDALTRQPSGEAEETEQSIAADCYHWIADCIGTLPGYSVQEHVQTMKETLAACSDFLHDFVPAEEGGCSEAVELAKNCRAVLSGRIDKYEASHPSADAPGVTVDEWRPIETAPKEAPYWVVWSAYYQRPVVVTQRSNDNTYWEGDWDFDVQATHWTAALAPKPEGEL